MKTIIAVIALGAATASARPVVAQTTTLGMTNVRTYYGCAVSVSCHFITVSWGPSSLGIAGTVRARSWFSNPWGAGNPWRLIVSSFAYPAWAFSDEYGSRIGEMRPYFDESWALDASADGASIPNWLPVWVQMRATYGTPAGTPSAGPYSADIMLVQTPEPGTLLLLATGLGGVVLGARRRRRKLYEGEARPEDGQ